MGKLITFWSPIKGQAKVTSSLCAVAASYGIKNPELTTAVTSVGDCRTDLEDYMDEKFGRNKKRELYDRSGMAALLAGCKQSAPTKEMIRRCALPLLLSSIELFPGLRQEMKLIHGKSMEELEFYIITEKLREEYDLTLVDLETGENERAARYRASADLSVVVLPQNPSVWQQYKELRTEPKGERLLLLGGCLKHSRYGTGALQRSFLGAEPVKTAEIPMNAGFMDALATGRTMEFFLRNENVKKREENYEFMVETGKTAEKIRKSVLLHGVTGRNLPSIE